MFVGAIVLLLLISALVVDLGFVIMLRRHEQNAADPGAVAAARYIPAARAGDATAPSKMWTAACFYAIENGFLPRRTDTSAACHPGGAVDGSSLTVNWPPGPSAVEYAGDPGFVEVIVTRQQQSFFAGLAALPIFNVSTGAVAAFDEGTAGSSSLIALSPKGCGGGAAAQVNGGGGSGGIYIKPADGVTEPGGYIQVNSTCGAPANSGDDQCLGSQGGFVMNGGAEVHAPALFVQGACGNTGTAGDVQIGEIDEQAPYVGDPLSLVRPPDPGDLPTQPCPGGGPQGTPSNPQPCNLPGGPIILNPGTYYGGWKIGNGSQVTLNPGIYIMAGGGITQTGGNVLASANGRVLIYSTDAPLFQAACLTSWTNKKCQDDIDLSGNGSVDLRGLDATAPCPPYGAVGCPYGGLLLWQDGKGSGAYTGHADITVGGLTSLNVEGTIYSAGGNVKIDGNPVATGCTPDVNGDTNCAAVQIIADTFQVGGAAVLEMPYDPNEFYHPNLKGLVR